MPETQYSVKKITDLTANTTAADTDLYVLGNAGTATMRKITFANIAKAVLNKLTSFSFSGLTTSAKNLVGAVNELNSKAARLTVSVATGTTGQYDFGSEQTYLILLTGHNSVVGFRGLYILLPNNINPVIPASNYTVSVSGTTVTITNTASAGTVVGVII